MNKNLGINWWLIVGGFGFLAGYVGPIILDPGANQGPLLGIFVTGPIGFLLGTLCWVLSYLGKWTYDFQKKIATALCILFVMGIVIYRYLPKPEWIGRIYQVQVIQCSPSSVPGEVVLDTLILKEKIVKKEKPLFRPLYYQAGELTWKGSQKISFYKQGTCVDFPNEFRGTYFVSDVISSHRDKAVLSPMPEFLKEF